ncbi:hypothetical protein K2173_001216 [Erythroxylum novogranatense]|uniref:S-adenosylmethionine-dependent methyltransferase n=1 Tax=Erythroxylum novogranatense TaxID=1862640 RepID=A0AAV8T4H2_9ROSI|nr:hypothetical protein K2173_001216 [Erythroxylum novogranatense]
MTTIPCESYPMIGGDGAHSYTQNSAFQRSVVDAAKEMIHQAVKNSLDFKNPSFSRIEAFRIADFGCSTGPNTFTAVENIIDSIANEYDGQDKNNPPFQFQVFFNDHTNNDFNVLFMNLPPGRKYFAAGVPGTFYGILFPKSTLHFGHSSNALHWLSKVPEDVADSKSPAWNKNSITYSGSVDEVSKAYSGRFRDDMNTFLSSRAHELVSGGLMVVILPCLPEGILLSETTIGMNFSNLRCCLMEMADSGIISEEKVDVFNLPIYYPRIKELETVIHKNGCFSIEKMENMARLMKHVPPTVGAVTSHTRAIFQALIKEHFGAEIVDDLFERFAKRLHQNFYPGNLENHKHLELFVLLKRIGCK